MAEINFKSKTALVFGIADDKSLAFAIAKKLSEAGANLIVGYQPRNEAKISSLKISLKHTMFLPFDVVDEALFEDFFKKVSEKFGKIDFIVHSIAFTKRETLKGKLVDTSKENYQLALDVSAFSLAQIVQKFQHSMNDSGSIVALTFTEKVVPNYNVMGVCKAALNSSIRYIAYDLGERQIRVNGILAGPVATSAASAIDSFPEMMKTYAVKSPLKRNITSEEVANTALFLLSDLAKGITGEIVCVDAGFSVMGI